MNTNQTTCDPDRIELFLDQKLSNEEQSAFESHLSRCGDCRQRLETAAASDDIWSDVCDSLRDPPMLPSPSGRGVGGEGEPDNDSALDSAAGEDVSSSQATILKLLAPTDDDRMIGRWGTYEVVGVVGTGGMGVVLKAFDAALNRYVAIKILAPHLGTSGAAIRRFSREGKAAAAVVHDNVIEIYGVSEAAGLPYLVMPYVRGPSLQRRLDDEGPLAVVEILRVAMQAAAGLAAAHAQGLVHRDVKPANILLADGIERVKLTDFGLARAADDASLTRTGVIAGTPQYMSPEQARGEPVDPRSDLFSLGSVLYAMSTGRPPFRAETSYGVLRRITDEEPRPIREINPDIPDWLCGIVGKLMAKRPADRFESAHEVAGLLEQCLAHVQQPTVVPLPHFSPLLPGEGQGVRAAPRSPRSRNHLLKGTLAMLTLLGISLFAVGAVSTTPPDISGNWQGDDWGQVTLTQTAPGEYTGTYTDTVAKEKGPGKIDLKWSRIERRFNGTWREGDDDRFGDLSVRLINKEIRGALTTDPKSKVNPATPRLADLVWRRAETNQSATGRREANAAFEYYGDARPTVEKDRLPAEIVLPVYRELSLEEVRKELGVSFEQTEKLKQITWSYEMELRKVEGQTAGKSRPGELAQRLKRLGGSVRSKVEKVLTLVQLAKYNSILFQRLALSMLGVPKARRELGLTTEQDDAYLDVDREMRETSRRIARDATAKALQLLTPTQTRLLKEILKENLEESAFLALLRNPVVAERLDLTLRQIKVIGELGEEIRRRHDEMGRESTARMLNKLSADQRQKLREMVENLDKTLEVGLPSTQAADAPHARAVQFDGNHYAKVEPPPKFTSGDFTISLWFNPVRSGDWALSFMRGFGWRDQRGDIGFQFNRDSGDLGFAATSENYSGDENGSSSGWIFGWGALESRLRSPVRYGQWNHAAVTRRGDTYTMWMNGRRVVSEKSSADISDAGNTNPFIVGGMMYKQGVRTMYQGALDDFRIFHRCLSEKEIADMFKSNGDEGFLQGEGRLKFGPLRAVAAAVSPSIN